MRIYGLMLKCDLVPIPIPKTIYGTFSYIYHTCKVYRYNRGKAKLKNIHTAIVQAIS